MNSLEKRLEKNENMAKKAGIQNSSWVDTPALHNQHRWGVSYFVSLVLSVRLSLEEQNNLLWENNV